MKNSLDLLSTSNTIQHGEILFLDIRVHNQKLWDSLSLPTKNIVLNEIENIKVINDIPIEAIDEERFFIDPFLPNKTLTVLVDPFCDTYSKELKLELEEKNTIAIDFVIEPNNLEEDYLDRYKSIRSEICLSLLEMGVGVKEHYKKENTQFLEIRASQAFKHNIDAIQKAKYAILSICEIYGLEINQKAGIFAKELFDKEES